MSAQEKQLRNIQKENSESLQNYLLDRLHIQQNDDFSGNILSDNCVDLSNTESKFCTENVEANKMAKNGQKYQNEKGQSDRVFQNSNKEATMIHRNFA